MIDSHALSGPYAVDALDDIERARFERHLGHCPTCQEEVASLRATATHLSATAAQPAPVALRERVLADIATVRPMPPVVARAEEVRRSSTRRFPALVAAAAALVVIGGAGATAWHPWSPDQPPSSPVGTVMSASDAHTYTQDVAGGGTVALTISPSQNKAVVTTSGVAALPHGKVYDLWLQNGTLKLAGSLTDTNQPVELQGDVNRSSLFAMTVEDDPGTTTPQGKTVGSIQLTQS